MKIVKKSTLKHLSEDRKTWLSIAKLATSEAKSDEKMIKKIKRKCR
jgi:hypothetical protein